MSKQVEGMGEATLAAAEKGVGAAMEVSARADTGMSVRTLPAPQKAYVPSIRTSAQGCTGRRWQHCRSHRPPVCGGDGGACAHRAPRSSR